MQTIATYAPSTPQTTPQTTPQAQPGPSGNQPNWWEKLLPTAGGIVGGTIGDIALPFAGGFAGGALGGAGGQMLEDWLTHQSLTKNLAGAALSNGIGNAIGGGIGWDGSKALGLIGGKLATDAAETAGTAATDTGAQVAKRGILGNAAVNSLMRQFGGNLTKEDSAALLDKGVTNAEQLKSIIPEITGKTGGEGAAFTNAVDTAMSNTSKTVDISNEAKNWPDMLDPHTASLADKPKALQSISNVVNNTFKNIAKASGKSVSEVETRGVTNPNLISMESGALKDVNTGALYQEAQKLQKLGNTIADSAPKDFAGNITDPIKSAQADVYKTLGNRLEQAATSNAPLTAADKASLMDSISNIEKVNPKVYNSLKTDISNAKGWQDMVGHQSLWVRASQALKAVSNTANRTVGVTPADIAAGTAGNIRSPGDLAKATIGSIIKGPTINRAETKGANFLAQLARRGSSANGAKVLKLLARIPAVSAANAAAGNLSNPINRPNANVQAQNNQNSAINNTGGNPMNSPLAEVFNQYANLMQEAPAVYGPMVGASLAQMAPLMQKYTTAAPLIQELQQQYPGAQGPMGGLEMALGRFMPGSPYNTYLNTQNAAQSALGGLLGVPGPQLGGFMPNVYQTPGTAAPGIGALQGIGATLP